MITEDQRHLEQQILRLLDQIIDEASQVSMMVGPYRDERFVEGARMMEQLVTLCEILVEGRKEYVEPTLRQLLQQKLPQPKILRSFGEFQNTLEEYVKVGLERREKDWERSQEVQIPALINQNRTPHIEEIVATESIDNEKYREKDIEEYEIDTKPEPVEEEKVILKKEKKVVEDYSEAILMRTLQEIYPTCEIVAGSPPGTTGITAYVPAKGFAIVCTSSPRRSGRREYNCRQLGLQVVYIAHTDLHSPNRLKRSIMRSRLR
ncbi:hypothetical protein F9B85_00055 [Heliorestis acidaminivorans]|uniref:Uncharacterized protein n=1 Tax=Heliorestis acidaminivorans TaxID=553427 RepID=A0A6I0ETL8_9FIRM|nr:hypothetical protein [Heliorestis acidaminivorans]KAB2954135.1 hypothetical protein F9B85_00055 [Heliorestis acidaminivorans]